MSYPLKDFNETLNITKFFWQSMHLLLILPKGIFWTSFRAHIPQIVVMDDIKYMLFIDCLGEQIFLRARYFETLCI
jgi:hypothetical protein